MAITTEAPPIHTEYCRGCDSFKAEGTPEQRVYQLQLHWPNCRGVVSLTFHPDGSLSGVTFGNR